MACGGKYLNEYIYDDSLLLLRLALLPDEKEEKSENDYGIFIESGS